MTKAIFLGLLFLGGCGGSAVAGAPAPSGFSAPAAPMCCLFQGNSYCTDKADTQIYTATVDGGCQCVIVEDEADPFWGPGECQ